MANRLIEVHYSHRQGAGITTVKDWWEFADWLKQTNETIGSVVVYEWKYI